MLLVRVADLLCALPIRQVREVMRPLPIHQLDQAPAGVAGWPWCVASRCRWWSCPGWSASPGSAADIARYVIIHAGQHPAALAVSEVVGMRAIDRATLSALPALLDGGQQEAIDALGVRDRQLLLVLNAARLLPAGMVTGPAAGTPR